MNDKNNTLIDIIALFIGLQNLYENRVQTAQNDVNTANDQQAEYLLSEINRRFDEQNEILAEQNRMIESLLEKIERVI